VLDSQPEHPGVVRLLAEGLQHPVPASSGIHVVLLLDQFPRVLGGGERVVLRTAALLQSAGYRVSIVTFAILCGPETLQEAVCPIYLLPLSGVFRPEALKAAWQLGRFLREQHVRIVQTYFESSNLFGGIVTKTLSDARLIWNFRDMGILREEKHWRAYRLLRHMPDHVVAVSEQVRQHAIEVDGMPADRVSVIYNGCDLPAGNTAEYASLAAMLGEKTGPLIVTIGNIRPVKGHDVLVEAAALVLQKHPGARFAIGGEALEADFFQQLQARVAALGLTDRVLFLGSVKAAASLLRHADVFVLPSRSEGFSNAIVEAMAAGLPTVVTAVGGNGEAVVQGQTGWIVPPEDPGALASALDKLLSSPETMLAMGSAARRRAEALFTTQSMLEHSVTVFRKLLY
jgi:glycosyltransferase involved in cell wall biosynthesis